MNITIRYVSYNHSYDPKNKRQSIKDHSDSQSNKILNGYFITKNMLTILEGCNGNYLLEIYAKENIS